MEHWSKRLDELAAQGLRRELRPQPGPAHTIVEREGRLLVNLASNNYLGLATDPRVVDAASAALLRWGIGAGASRLVTGTFEVHEALEAELAAFKGTEAALVFSSGYAANLGVLSALAGPRDQIFSDALNHASLIDGCRMSHARVQRYRHNDLDQLETLLRAAPPRGERLIVTDAIFSMDGDFAPLPALCKLAERYGAILIVDDAHGTGVVGEEGRGTAHHFGVQGRVPVQVGTLSKALGVQGGFVAGSRQLIELLIHRARSFVYSTAIAPVLVEAAREALSLATAEGWRNERRAGHLLRLRRELMALGYRVLGADAAPMTAVLVGDPEAALALAALLKQHGVLAPAIRPPTVPPGTSRIRLAPMATHGEQQIGQVVEAFSQARAAV